MAETLKGLCNAPSQTCQKQNIHNVKKTTAPKLDTHLDLVWLQLDTEQKLLM